MRMGFRFMVRAGMGAGSDIWPETGREGKGKPSSHRKSAIAGLRKPDGGCQPLSVLQTPK